MKKKHSYAFNFMKDVFKGLFLLIVVVYSTSTFFRTINQTPNEKTPQKKTTPQYPSRTNSIQRSLTPTPTTTNKIIQSPNKASLVNCTGPDKVVFKTTMEECVKFNQAWGVKTTVLAPSPVGESTTPVYPCVLSFGTYNLTSTDCTKFKQQDQGLQEWESSLESLKDYQSSTSNPDQTYNTQNTPDYVYIDYSQQNTQCKGDVLEWLNDEIRSIEAIGRASGSGSDVAYKTSQAQSKASVSLAECDQLYPVR